MLPQITALKSTDPDPVQTVPTPHPTPRPDPFLILSHRKRVHCSDHPSRVGRDPGQGGEEGGNAFRHGSGDCSQVAVNEKDPAFSQDG